MEILKRMMISILVITFALTGASLAIADVGSSGSAKMDKKLMNKIDRLENRVKQLERKGPSSVEITEMAEVYSPEVGGGVLRAMEDIQVSGYIDTSFSMNTNRPSTGSLNDIGDSRAGINALRSFDRNNNSFTLNQLKLTLEKAAPETGGLGFRADVILGEDAKYLNSITHGNMNGPIVGRGINGGAGAGVTAALRNTAIDNHSNVSNVFIENAYGILRAPYGNGIDIMFGVMTTLNGFEKIEGKDNWNASRGLLFSWGGPFATVGIRGVYEWNDKFKTTVGINNGGNNFVKPNNRATMEGKAEYQLTDAINLSSALQFGNTSPSGDENGHHGFTIISDSIINIEMTDKWDLATEFLFNNTNGRGAFFGIGVFQRYELNDWIRFNNRFEWANDTSNYFFGAPEDSTILWNDGYDAWEMSFGMDFDVYTNLLARLEYRFDATPGKDRFDWDNEFQSTFLAELIYSF